MKLQFVLLGCLVCGIASVYGSQSDESDALVEGIGKYPRLVKAIHKLVQYVINSEPARPHYDGENDNVSTNQSDEASDEDVAAIESDEASDEHAIVSQSDEASDEEDTANQSDEASDEDVAASQSDEASDEDFEASQSDEASDEDDDTSFGLNPTDLKPFGKCLSHTNPLQLENCLNNDFLGDVTETLNNLKGTVVNKTDFEISIYIAALDEYFRSRFTPKQNTYPAFYRVALLKTLNNYFHNTTDRVTKAKQTLSELRKGFSSLNKKIEKECKTKQAPGISCDQTVLKWYRHVIKECPAYKDVMKLHQDVGQFKDEWNRVSKEIFKTIEKETGPRTFALTQRKYVKMLNQGRELYISIMNANKAEKACKQVIG